jgi:hypothetical protein
LKKNYWLLIFSIYFFSAVITWASSVGFPTIPDTLLTPGELCKNPSELRYPEKIPYCNRAVDREEKWDIIQNYMKKYNFVINDKNRAEFKIDHYIPLCMGGANTEKNLWPQHQSVFVFSDPYEAFLCHKLEVGEITQKQAIEKMKYGKSNYKEIPKLINEDSQLR